MRTPTLLQLGRAAAAVGLTLACLSAHAAVASFSRSGQFLNSSEVQSFGLDVGSASDLRLWTTSFAAGHADPVLALFDFGNGRLVTLSDDTDGPYPQVDASQGVLDAGIVITDLAAGRYLVAVSLSPNLPAGTLWMDGYTHPSAGDAIVSDWTVQVALTNAAPIPEPAPTALLLAGLAALGWVARRRHSH